MLATAKPTPCSERRLPGWALRLAARATQGRLTSLDKLWPYPELILQRAGMTADRWQTQVLRTRKAQILLLCSRQVGKTLVAAALALRTALLEAPALVLILTPSERQSSEFMLRIKELHEALRQPRNLAGPVRSVHEKRLTEVDRDQLYFRLPSKTRESSLQLHLDNGSRIIGLPASEGKIRGHARFVIGQKVGEAIGPDNTSDGSRPGRHRVLGGIVQGLAACFPSLDHSTEFCGDAFLVLWQEFEFRVANGRLPALHISLGSQVNRQRPIEEVRAEHAVIRGDRHYEPVLEPRRFTGTRCGEMDLVAGYETLQETRADKSPLAARTVEPDVVEAHHANFRVLGKLPLKLTLHRPVDALIQDVCLGYVPADEFGYRALAGVTLGRGHHDDRLGAGPVVSEQNGQRSGNGIGAVRVGRKSHHIQETVDRFRGIDYLRLRSQVQQTPFIGGLLVTGPGK